MKVQIELPNGWLDSDHSADLTWMFKTVKQEVERQVKEKAIEAIMKDLVIPKITIDPKEIKDRMLTLLAKRALEEGTV